MDENPAILRIQQIYKNFSGLKVLEGVNIAVKQGERHAIIGPNGAGKTTLFNMISGRFKPSAGSIGFKGQDITGKSPHLLNRMGIGRSFQMWE